MLVVGDNGWRNVHWFDIGWLGLHLVKVGAFGSSTACIIDFNQYHALRGLWVYGAKYGI